MSVGDSTYRIETAETSEERRTGLSRHSALPANRAMLFVFDEPGRHCIWMKGMQFSIDIVWLSAERNVLHVEENVSPDTYPKSFCPPSDDTYYVIELASGQVQQSNLQQNKQIDFCYPPYRSCYY